MEIIIVLIVIAVIVFAAAIKKPNNTPNPVTSHKEPEQTSENRPDYSKCYQAKYVLTRNEWYEYRKLKEYAEKMNLQVCPKVRLLDIIEPRRGASNYMSLLGKVQSKHIDFLICDQNLHIKAILELDDNSHNSADRQERDHFVDEILTSVGYKVIRTRSITEDTLKPLGNTETKQAATEQGTVQARQETA